MKKLFISALIMLAVISCEPALAEQDTTTIQAPIELPRWPKADYLVQDNIEYAAFGIESAIRLQQFRIVAEANQEIGQGLNQLAIEQEALINTMDEREKVYQDAFEKINKKLKRERLWRSAERIGFIVLTILVATR